MDQIPLNTHYDSEADVFSAWTCQPDEVVCVEPVEGIVLRMDANTDELVGYTIIDFRARFRGADVEAISLPIIGAKALLPLRAQLRMLREAETVAA